TVLETAQTAISLSDFPLGAELAFQRGLCAISDPQTAQKHFEQAAQLGRGHDDFITARALIGSGYLLSKEGQYGDAIAKLKDALAITQSLLLREKAFGNLAECYAELGDWRQSIFLAEQSEKLAEQINNVRDQERGLIDLGRAHFAIHEYQEAEPYYSHALTIAKSLNDAEVESRCLNNLVQLALRRHDLSTAERYWKEESSLSLEAARHIYMSFDAAGIARERKELAKAESLLSEILKSKTNESLRLKTQRELAEVYWQESKIGQADRTFRATIDDAESIVSHLPPQYRMSFLDQQPFYDSYVRYLVAQGKSLWALKIAERGKAQILGQAAQETHDAQSSFDLTKVQAALKKRNQVALAYSLTDDESFLWIITPAQLKVFTLPAHTVIGPQIDAYNKEIGGPRRSMEDSSVGQALYKALVQPAESLIPKGSRVVIIPSKMLSVLSFESLIVPGTRPHHWIDD